MRDVKCHKAILCRASKFFKAMCTPTNGLDATRKDRIVLEDDYGDDTNEAVLRHIYNFTYAEIEQLCSI